MTRQWNSLTETRNFPHMMLKGFAQRMGSSIHMLLHSRILELKWTSTGHKAELERVARIVSNSYVSWELRTAGLFLLRQYRYSLIHKRQMVCAQERNYDLLRAGSVKSCTAIYAICFFLSLPRPVASWMSANRILALVERSPYRNRKIKRVLFVACTVWPRES